MAGQDVSIFDRMMRGLSQAADETSKDGEKARGTLARIGVDLRSATGEIKPTSQVLLEISEGLAKLPAGFERDAAALGLFKRAGIEAVPVISGLTDNVKRAKELGLGATDEDLRRWERNTMRMSRRQRCLGTLCAPHQGAAGRNGDDPIQVGAARNIRTGRNSRRAG